MSYLIAFILCLLSFFIGAQLQKIKLALRRYLFKKFKSDNLEDDTRDDASADESFDFEDEDLKMVFVVREDIKIGPGKTAAQVGHAAVDLYTSIKEKNILYNVQALDYWSSFGAKKIVLKAKNFEELQSVYKSCRVAKIPVTMIRDAGHTQVDPGTVTVVGVGPAPSSEIDKITRKFKLMR